MKGTATVDYQELLEKERQIESLLAHNKELMEKEPNKALCIAIGLTIANLDSTLKTPFIANLSIALDKCDIKIHYPDLGQVLGNGKNKIIVETYKFL